MKFTFTEREGDAPIEEWLVEKVKEYGEEHTESR